MLLQEAELQTQMLNHGNAIPISASPTKATELPRSLQKHREPI